MSWHLLVRSSLALSLFYLSSVIISILKPGPPAPRLSMSRFVVLRGESPMSRVLVVDHGELVASNNLRPRDSSKRDIFDNTLLDAEKHHIRWRLESEFSETLMLSTSKHSRTGSRR